MQIKLKAGKNIYGARKAAGSVLTIGDEIPEWQAEKFIGLGLASEYTPPAPKKKANKKVAGK